MEGFAEAVSFFSQEGAFSELVSCGCINASFQQTGSVLAQNYLGQAESVWIPGRECKSRRCSKDPGFHSQISLTPSCTIHAGRGRWSGAHPLLDGNLGSSRSPARPSRYATFSMPVPMTSSNKPSLRFPKQTDTGFPLLTERQYYITTLT